MAPHRVVRATLPKTACPRSTALTTATTKGAIGNVLDTKATPPKPLPLPHREPRGKRNRHQEAPDMPRKTEPEQNARNRAPKRFDPNASSPPPRMTCRPTT